MSELVVNEKGLLKPQNIEEAFRVAKAFAMSGILPTRFKTVESVFTAMQFSLELGLPPLTGMRQIAVVNGTPSIYGDLPLSVVLASGKMEWIREHLIDSDMKKICMENQNINKPAFASITVVKRKGDDEVCERIFTMDDAKLAGLLSSPTWQKYPKRMLVYRSRSMALKDKFADALNGVAIAEYDFNVGASEIESAPQKKVKAVTSESSSGLNAIYGDAIEAQSSEVKAEEAENGQQS